MPKNAPASLLRHLIASGLGGLSARQPSVQGTVATRYEIMKMSCQLWSSVDVTYVHPPHVNVLKTPTPATIAGRFEFGRFVRKYQSATRAKRGPEVMAMKTINTDRSGYRSPMVEDTEGNHSSG